MGSYMNAMKFRSNAVVLIPCFGFLSIILLWSMGLQTFSWQGLDDQSELLCLLYKILFLS